MSVSRQGDFAADRRLLLTSLISVLIGVVAAFVAVVLLAMIHFFTNLFYYHQFSLANQPPTNDVWGLGAIAVPVVGGLIIGFMARYGSDKIRGHGIPEALEAILFGRSIMQPKVAILKPLSSAISIGSGGPFGAEGPIIMTGGAFGSILAQAFRLTAVERKTLLVAGAAAGMTAVFGTPVAAVLLAVELLLFEWKPRSVVPTAIAAMVASGMRPLLLGPGPLFPITPHDAIGPVALVATVLVGLLAGAFSTGISTFLYKLEDLFGELPVHWMWWPALGGIVVGIGGYFEPRALGVGYDVIDGLLKGEFTAWKVLGLVLVKGGIWVVALASGTSGGVLAPLLIMGAGLGVVESTFLPGPASLWPLVSMAAVMGGIMRAPFMAVIFALELTHDVRALPPLLLGSIVSYAFTVLLMKRSILTEKVARRGYDIYCEYSVDPLERMKIEDAMTQDVVVIPSDMPMAEVTKKFFTTHKHGGYPVVDPSKKLVGILVASDVLERSAGIQFAGELASRPIVGFPKESCRIAAERMVEAGIGRLPIVALEEPSKLLGIITRSDLLKPRFRDLIEERRSEIVLSLKTMRDG